jgi:DNA-binding CsgD family transcriptional regulator
LVALALLEAAGVAAKAEQPSLRITDSAEALRALSLAWGDVCAAMRRSGTAEETVVGLEALENIRAAESAVTEEQVDRRDAMFGRLASALQALREGASTDGVIKAAGDAVGELGFDRAIVSAVTNGRWVPQWVSDQRDPAWSEEILEVGRTDLRVLDGQLVESQLMARGPGIIVRNVRGESRVHDRLVRVARTMAYIAVPLVADDDVIGFLHADCYYEGRDFGDLDRRLLSLFAATLAESIRQNETRRVLAEAQAGLDQISRSLSDRGTDWSPRSRSGLYLAATDVQPTARAPGEFSRLSKRELEVMRLVAEGRTNAGIGRRLLISEGTVKTHVQNIMRKLETSNRAELVTKWLRAEGVSRKY